MLLLHLLFLRVIRLLLIQIQVFLVLLLLEFVSFPLLLRDLLVLLLLVFLVQLRVARIWSAPCQGREVVRVDCRTGSCCVVLGASLISSPIAWGIRRSCLFGRDSATVIKISGSGCGLPHLACPCSPTRVAADWLGPPAHVELEPLPAGHVSDVQQPLLPVSDAC